MSVVTEGLNSTAILSSSYVSPCWRISENLEGLFMRTFTSVLSWTVRAVCYGI